MFMVAGMVTHMALNWKRPHDPVMEEEIAAVVQPESSHSGRSLNVDALIP